MVRSIFGIDYLMLIWQVILEVGNGLLDVVLMLLLFLEFLMLYLRVKNLTLMVNTYINIVQN